MKELRNEAVELARRAGDVLVRAYQKRGGTVASKSTIIDLVTDADRAAEEVIVEAIASRYPDHALLAEESGAAGRDGPFRWIIDPLDGTVNFAHRQPHFSTLIAVQERTASGGFETVVGVIFDPLRDEMFTASRGDGATLNDVRLRVSVVGRLIDATAASGFAYDRLFNETDNHREFCRMNFLTQGVRRLGSAGLDLAYVASGRIDFFWEYRLNPWDLAAGALLVTEAGGTVSDMDGGRVDLDTGDVIASNCLLHDAGRAALDAARRLPVGSRQGLEDHLPPEVVAKLHEGGG
ncbi:MAG: inositol monophosphatase family protein [Myxococcota bacterium]